MRDTIEGRMLPLAERPRLRPIHPVLALALTSLVWSVPSLFRSAHQIGTVIGTALLG